ncbi:thiamine phosphate synthase [Echinicola strongylocentroti]|uniref:Thiamine phosphate synthase n=1 Tax=Echinicola strongylocentroti TaxID=1795355 RepID=A0A2Z4ICK5_9BACT|nr:thiamine phosphate synthase [Echinicola strongylocentroti]AWW28682.1 thiamine phosphate synthase [Echinicola strongylocentroti]
MRYILISSPEEVKEEIQTMVQLLDHGLFRLHIRKPDWSSGQIAKLISQLPPEYYPKVSLHGHHELIGEFGLGGVHYKSNQKILPSSKLVSKSFHQLESLQKTPHNKLDYAFISPIFDSISKPGYFQAFAADELSRWMKETKPLLPFQVFALGGISPEKTDYLDSLGFDGAALLGSIWKGEDTASRLKLFFNHKQQP